MTALDEQYLRRRRAEDGLARIVIDETGKPERDLPKCPKCEVGEMFVSKFQSGGRNRFGCYACPYYFDCPAPDAVAKPEPLIGERLAAFIGDHVGSERIRVIGAIHTQQVQNTLRNVLELAAAGEVRWADSFRIRARGEERSALEHLKAVLARWQSAAETDDRKGE